MISKRNTIMFVSIMAVPLLVLSVVAEGFDGHGGAAPALALRLAAIMTSKDNIVTYEAFGAIGDGVNDDLPAICEAHEYANANGFSVKTKPAATYHLGSKALTVIIATDTDWSTSRCTIDDTQGTLGVRLCILHVTT